MKKKNTIIVGALCALFFIGSVAGCKHGRCAGGVGEFDLSAATDRIAFQLDLTASQRKDLEQIAREITEEAKTMHADPESRHQEWANLIRQDAIDKDAVDKLITGKLERVQEMAAFAAERLIPFFATLTPEQREVVATRIETRSAKGCRFGFR